MSESTEQQSPTARRPLDGTVLKLPCDVSIYRMGNVSMIFQRGDAAVQIRSEPLVKESGDVVVRAMEEGVPSEELRERLEMPDEVFSSLVTTLVNRGLLVMIPGEDGSACANGRSRAECLIEAVGGTSWLSADRVRKAAEAYVVRVAGPGALAEKLGALLDEFGIAHTSLDVQDEDKKLSMSLPDPEDGTRELYVVYLADWGPWYRQQLAHQLILRGVTWLSVFRDVQAWVVGPLHQPGGACPICYESRKLRNMANPEVFGLIASDRCVQVRRGRETMTPLSAARCASVCCSMVLRHFVSAKPVQYRMSTIYEIDDDGLVSGSTLYKDAYCKACSPGLVAPGIQEYRVKQPAP